jgi:CheY-like chemotaxis protein
MCAQILALHENDATSADVVYSLEKSGHNVVLAGTFGEAIAILKSLRKIDLVISDVHLENGGNVFDFLRWVKDHPSKAVAIPFVLFSCRPSPLAKHLVDAVRTSARILGASKYIAMDAFDSDDFRKQMDLLLEEAHQSSEIELKASR